MTKAAQAKSWTLHGWGDGSRRSYPEPEGLFPLAVSSSGRYLEDAQGQPFFMFGDTAWSLFVQLSDAEVETYLDDRQAKGFNAILINLIEKGFADDPPNMAGFNGTAPFTTPDDIRTPNDDYFDRAVSIVEDMGARGMVAMLTPAYLGFQLGSEGWWSALAARTVGECEDYGEYLGAKFANLPNIIWVMGGDAYDADVVSRTEAIVSGLKSAGRDDWLFTYHAAPGSSSADVYDSGTWLDLNAVYDQDSEDLPGQHAAAWAESNTRPHFLLEARYEQEGSPAIDRALLRNQSWWAALSGAAGAIFGNNPIWHFEAPNPIFSYSGTWVSNLNSNGSVDYATFISIWSQLPWYTLAPDTTGTFLTGGEGTGTSRAVAAFAADGTFAAVYTPTQKQLTIDHTHFAGSMNARWISPVSGAATTIGTVGNTGSGNYTPPSSGDWLLVFEAA